MGAGGSGKSTVFKQARILYLDSFPDDVRQTYKHTVHSNMVDIFQALANELLENHVLSEPIEVLAAGVRDLSSSDPMTSEVADLLRSIWGCDVIKVVYEQRDSFWMPDNAPYFLKHMDRVLDPAYVPTVDDILRTRVRTTGVVEMAFEMDGVQFRLWDVGGQRNERKKWIHCFDNCQAVIFIVGISEYDQTLAEDVLQNRLTESLTLFAEICNSRYFEQTDMILFLNKRDLFKEKIGRIPLKNTFPEFKGGGDYDAGCNFIKEQFLAVNKLDRQIFVHFTCATDTQNMKLVLEDARAIVLHSGMRASGFM